MNKVTVHIRSNILIAKITQIWHVLIFNDCQFLSKYCWYFQQSILDPCLIDFRLTALQFSWLTFCPAHFCSLKIILECSLHTGSHRSSKLHYRFHLSIPWNATSHRRLDHPWKGSGVAAKSSANVDPVPPSSLVLRVWWLSDNRDESKNGNEEFGGLFNNFLKGQTSVLPSGQRVTSAQLLPPPGHTPPK